MVCVARGSELEGVGLAEDCQPAISLAVPRADRIIVDREFRIDSTERPYSVIYVRHALPTE